MACLASEKLEASPLAPRNGCCASKHPHILYPPATEPPPPQLGLTKKKEEERNCRSDEGQRILSRLNNLCDILPKRWGLNATSLAHLPFRVHGAIFVVRQTCL